MRRKSFHNKYNKEEVGQIYSIHVIPLIFIRSNLKHMYQLHQRNKVKTQRDKVKTETNECFLLSLIFLLFK